MLAICYQLVSCRGGAISEEVEGQIIGEITSEEIFMKCSPKSRPGSLFPGIFMSRLGVKPIEQQPIKRVYFAPVNFEELETDLMLSGVYLVKNFPQNENKINM